MQGSHVGARMRRAVLGSAALAALVFFAIAQSVAAAKGIVTNLIIGVPEMYLRTISAGAVFMGANSYIGNGPNFMVKAICEENEIIMPSFFGYMAWSMAILIPLFVVIMFVFFWT